MLDEFSKTKPTGSEQKSKQLNYAKNGYSFTRP